MSCIEFVSCTANEQVKQDGVTRLALFVRKNEVKEVKKRTLFNNKWGPYCTVLFRLANDARMFFVRPKVSEFGVWSTADPIENATKLEAEFTYEPILLCACVL